MLILLSISLIGFMLVHRTISSMARDFAFSHHQIITLSVINLLVMSAFIAICTTSAFSLWCFIGILLISLKFFPYILRFLLFRRLRATLIPVLDCVILGLQTGKSFRSSLHAAIEIQSGWIHHQLMELYETMRLSKNVIAPKSALLKDFQTELIEIDRSQVRCVEQVRALRRHLKMQEDFRRRSGQVTQQIKIQAIIVTALYLGLLSFVILQFGFLRHQFLIFLSLTIFILGLFWIFLTGRSLKWKV